MSPLVGDINIISGEKAQVERQAMKKCYVSVLISVVKLSFNKMNS